VILVVAGTHKQAEEWAKKHRATSWHYVAHAADTVGYHRSTSYVLVGTYYERKDWPIIEDQIECRNLMLL